MLSSYLRVWKSRGSSAGALDDTSNLNSEPHCHEVIYHIDICWHRDSLASGYLGTTSLPVLHPEPGRYWSEQLSTGRSPLCSHPALWHSEKLRARLFLEFLGTGEREEQFMCSSTLDLMWLRRDVLYAKIFEDLNHWRAAFGKLRHMRAWFPITNLCSVGCNNQLCVRQGVGFRALRTSLQKHVPMLLVPGEGKGTVQITGDIFWVG